MCDSSAQDNMLNFLIYSYFGITFENHNTEIINAAAKKGYNDAAMRGALVFKNKNYEKYDKNTYIIEYNNCKKKREAIRYVVRLKAMTTVIEYFNNLKKFVDFNTCDFNTWHNKLCKELVDSVDTAYDSLLENNCNKLYELEKNHQPYFTYGNAQKFVNMFLKNLYVLTVISSLYKEDKNADNWYKNYKWIIDKSKSFHIPLDSYIGVSSWSTINKYEDYLDKTKKVIEKTNKVAELNFSNENEFWINKAKEDTHSKLISFSKLLSNNKYIQKELKKYENTENK